MNLFVIKLTTKVVAFTNSVKQEILKMEVCLKEVSQYQEREYNFLETSSLQFVLIESII